MRWSNKPPKCVPQVSSLRPGLNSQIAMNLVCGLAFSLSCVGTPSPCTAAPRPPLRRRPRRSPRRRRPRWPLDSGQPEKSATLALSVRLRSLLAARGIQVVTTRESDTSVDPTGAQSSPTTPTRPASACTPARAAPAFTSSPPRSHPPAYALRAWKTAQAAWVTRSLALAGS